MMIALAIVAGVLFAIAIGGFTVLAIVRYLDEAQL
jgi:hypothetical protein